VHGQPFVRVFGGGAGDGGSGDAGCEGGLGVTVERDALSSGVLLDWLERVSGPSATAVSARGGEETGKKG